MRSHTSDRSHNRQRVSTLLARVIIAGGLLAACGSTHALACPPAEAPKNVDGKVVPPRKVVQIALLLDTSNSMDGLINQAKSQLWSVVRRVGALQSDGQAPLVQIALYEYGNNSISAEVNYVRQVSGFTSDLDLVSEKLFALSTNGGSEFCGAVVQSAMRDLAWCDRADAMRMVVIAGNEPFSQGSIDYRLAVPEAARRGVKVNTIFCGPRAEGVQGGWQDGSVLGNGTFFTIEQDTNAAQPKTPHDDEIIRCGTALNSTYIGFGARPTRDAASRNQSRQDANAAAMAPSVAAERAAAKASSVYGNASWDLVDATANDNWEPLTKLSKDELPEGFASLDLEAQKAKVNTARAERTKLRARIAELEQLRAQHLRDLAKAKNPEQATLGDALLQAIDTQAQEVGLTPAR
jgi:hypothetical protein